MYAGDAIMNIYNTGLVITRAACDKVTSHKMSSQDQ